MKQIFIKILLLFTLILSYWNSVNAAAPVLTDATGSVDENSADLTSVLTHTGSDSDWDTITYGIISWNTGSVFSIDWGTSEITVSWSLDYEILNQYILTVEATASWETDTATITIDITDINEAPVLSDITGSVDENSAKLTSVLTHTGSDVDSWSVLTYSILSWNIDWAFSINSNTSELTVSGSIDYDTTSIYNLIVEVNDGNLTNTWTFTINVIEDTIQPVFSIITTTSNNVKNISYAKDWDNISILLTINPEDTWKQSNNKALFSIWTSTWETNYFTKWETPKPFATRNIDVNSWDNWDFLITDLLFEDWEWNTITGVVLPASNIIVDTIDPVITFVDNVIAWPVQSDTLNITVTELNEDIASYEYAFIDDTTCTWSVTFTENFTSWVDIVLNDESHNDKYVCIKAEDAAWNVSYLVSSEKINIDITAPTVLNSNIVSNNNNSIVWAKSWDEITLTMEFSEEVNSPELMILNNTGSVILTQSGSSNIYLWKYITTSSDTEWEINYSINTTDIAWNILVEVSSKTDLSKVIFDRTKPTFDMTIWDWNGKIDMEYKVFWNFSDPWTENISDNLNWSWSMVWKVVIASDWRPAPGPNVSGDYTIRYSLSDIAWNIKNLVRYVRVNWSGKWNWENKMDVCNETNWDKSGDYYDWKCLKDQVIEEENNLNEKEELEEESKNIEEENKTEEKSLIKYTKEDIKKYSVLETDVIKYKNIIKKQYWKKIEKISDKKVQILIPRIDSVLEIISKKTNLSKKEKNMYIELLIWLKEILLEK